MGRAAQSPAPRAPAAAETRHVSRQVVLAAVTQGRSAAVPQCRPAAVAQCRPAAVPQ